MKKHNKKCNYQLFEKEKDYVICPVCGELLKDNIPQYIDKTKLYLQSLEYKKIISRVISIQFALFISTVISMAFIVNATQADYDVFMSDTLSIYIRPRAISKPNFILLILFFVGHKEVSKFLRSIIGEEILWYLNTIPFKIIKSFIFLFLIYIFMNFEMPSFYNSLLKESRRVYTTDAQLKFAISHIMVFRTFLIYHCFIVGFLMEWLDIYRFKKLKDINSMYEQKF